MTDHILSDDQQWYKDAIFYELRIRAFYDGNGDGIGDFRGLVEKLDYLQDLGITALWLLPFNASPLRDDGYDVADYFAIHPDCGTLADFKTLLREAHLRGIRVVTELVLNHTSDQHPWFERARRSPPGSRHRDFYVWRDTPEAYRDTRIIFSDSEQSNWRWDPVAKAYYWHRFYSHQPDLNYDNPAVRRAMLRVIDFWFGLGVDGMRLDAVPYLYEREGTSCENLLETHQLLKELRAHVDRKFKGRMLLAEANQWPEDAAQYFGGGDECHMAFHFPLMPRMFMAVHTENRFPLVDILSQTPAIPDRCQWALFLRNHDELTLEMVTEEERDYMYRAYASDPHMRINLGIRRRLAPLLGNNRRKIELLNGLLFSLPGTPVIYYGDEIGMGDNFYLGDRNGVRTPMHWSADRNAGFSRTNPQRLYLPIIIDPAYHFEAVNVEVQRSNLHSLLWWTKRLIALRKRHLAFGRGTIELLHPANPRILAFLRRYQDQTLLVIANLSRFVEYVELDLSRFKGTAPIELFSRRPFPAVAATPYLFTLGPHTFYWFALESPDCARHEESRANAGDLSATLSGHLQASRPLPQLGCQRHFGSLFAKDKRQAFEAVLPSYLRQCRWFRGKARVVKTASVISVISLFSKSASDRRELLDNQTARSQAVFGPRSSNGDLSNGTFAQGGLSDTPLLLIRVEYTEGEAETYLLPVAFLSASKQTQQTEQAQQQAAEAPASAIAAVTVTTESGGEKGLLFDAAGDGRFASAVLAAISRRRRQRCTDGELLIHTTPVLSEIGFGVDTGRRHSPGPGRGRGRGRGRSRSRNRSRDQDCHSRACGDGIVIGESIRPDQVACNGSDRGDRGDRGEHIGTDDSDSGSCHGLHLEPRLLRQEQTNTSIVFGNRFILKVLRRIEDGPSLDVEMGRFLTESAGFAHTPQIAAHVEFRGSAGLASGTLAVLQEYIPNQGDAWRLTLDELARFYERVLTTETAYQTSDSSPVESVLKGGYRQSPPAPIRSIIGSYLDVAALLGKRTAEMHLALASRNTNPDFTPEPFTPMYRRSLYQSLRNQTTSVFRLLRENLSHLPEHEKPAVARLLAGEEEVLKRFRAILEHKPSSLRTRIHGDYHLGQVLFTGKDFVIVDFEGEPARPLSDRRRKRSPLHDVAGMLRSFHYAALSAAATILGDPAVRSSHRQQIEKWARTWQEWSSASFVRAYLDTAGSASIVPQDPEELQMLLGVYLLEKVLYEIAYELNNRPDWLSLPIRGIAQILGTEEVNAG
ncbi:MAG: maltose alpha-D-glucosyltransferase [Pseudomonadota bacterium]